MHAIRSLTVIDGYRPTHPGALCMYSAVDCDVQQMFGQSRPKLSLCRIPQVESDTFLFLFVAKFLYRFKVIQLSML